MDGIHDLGGKMGHGAVDVNACLPDNRAGFEEHWHAQVFAVLRALPGAGALRNSDQFRHAIERIDPAAYLTHGYYGRWLGGLETLLVEAGVLTLDDVDARAGNSASAARPARQVPEIDPPTQPGTSIRMDVGLANFRVGDRVATRKVASDGHTRLPAYARGRQGEVIATHGGWVLPDTNAHGFGECAEHLYTVSFAANELWGEGAEPNASIRLDLFESYLNEVGDE